MDWQTVLPWLYMAGLMIRVRPFGARNYNSNRVPQSEYVVAAFGVAKRESAFKKKRTPPKLR